MSQQTLGRGAELAQDWRILLLAPTALVMQVAHPVIGAGVSQYSVYATDPWGRAMRSVWPVLAMVMIEDHGYGADMRALHRGIGGVDHMGRRYHAWNAEAAFFVLATACYISEQVELRFGTPMTEVERDEVFQAWRAAGLSFGIPERELPADVAEFDAWFGNVVETRLEDHPTAHELLGTLRDVPAPPYVPRLLWRPVARRLIGPVARLLVTGTLPPAVRDRLGLTWSARDERGFRLLARLVRCVHAMLPRPLRNVNGLLVRRYEQQIREHIARGAAHGNVSSAASHPGAHHVA